MQQSNTYIITFSVILTVVLGLLLSGTSQLLGPMQKEAIALDNKKQILGAVISGEEIAAMTPQEVNAFYESRIASRVVDINGEEVAERDGVAVTAESVDIAKNYKKPAEERLYPVYIFHAEGNNEDVENYILPLYGAGLWDAIWGYVALETDMNTVGGITLAHAGETPGLGARITEPGVQERYVGKSIYDESGDLVAVEMQKGEGKDYSGDPHQVDGLSGATITAKGVNNMLKNYLGYYQAYIESQKSSQSVAAL
ncbi:NADH:ubiquinone reductase (Na(+)-transporting) subunit C [Algoriphagus halophytocola]|uniref:Na(+)-translocating NADH-quinone reductase subunit C n=1 Tax=Algoriphagus halophytocola TaxID=2991499 RepID=A0ABY6MES1_9BACT|nr:MULTISPECIES: NADH:ubiquinone reductase (Na(+)-transporting) subunit C [unclassified Algoriphagus]UZD20932.1 NADH:ubiquinone reductase (Na(+)-transporting) subunit C [Algoriphagus sp. TR-M5]WBL42098.1 NADH:ubiquinone reductase (Na(+)-transporting) subunit C [Algoriphagus sp. TR-M9]